MLQHLQVLFGRDIDGLRAEMGRYPDDASLWQEVPGCPNSGGTLVLHAVGNLRHFIGAQLGRTGYIRDRAAEFATRDVARSELTRLVAAARGEVSATLANLDSATLSSVYPQPIADRTFTIGLWLLHLSTHLAYHLGQLDYHRRMVTGDSTSAGVVSVRGLPMSA